MGACGASLTSPGLWWEDPGGGGVERSCRLKQVLQSKALGLKKMPLKASIAFKGFGYEEDAA